MKLPRRHKTVLTFKHLGNWYKITCPENDSSVYTVWKEESTDDFTMLGTGNNPSKLEQRVYDNKYIK